MKSYKLFTVFGIPIKVHSTLVLLFPFIVYYLGNDPDLREFLPINPYLFIMFMILCGYVSILLHELGHSLVGIWRGYKIKEILLLPIGGVAKISYMTTSHKDELLVAAAGPLVSLLLSISFGGLAFLCAILGLRGLNLFTSLLSYLNLAWTLFNLVPAFPMDGGRILRAFLIPRIGQIKSTRIASQIGQTLSIAFGVYSLLRGHFFHVALAFYIYRAAGAEYRMLLLRETYNARFGWKTGPATPPQQPSYSGTKNDITVGPPSYRQTPPPAETVNNSSRVKEKLKRVFTNK